MIHSLNQIERNSNIYFVKKLGNTESHSLIIAWIVTCHNLQHIYMHMNLILIS